jgi:hypothetical protein
LIRDVQRDLPANERENLRLHLQDAPLPRRAPLASYFL